MIDLNKCCIEWYNPSPEYMACVAATYEDNLNLFVKVFSRCSMGYEGAWDRAYKNGSKKIAGYLLRYYGISEETALTLLKKKYFDLLTEAFKARAYPSGVEEAVGHLLEKGRFTAARQLIDMRKPPLRVIRAWVRMAAVASTSKGISYIAPRLKPTDIHLETALTLAIVGKRRSTARFLVKYGVPISTTTVVYAIQHNNSCVVDAFLQQEGSDPTSLLVDAIKSPASNGLIRVFLKWGAKVSEEAFHEAIVADRTGLVRALAARLEGNTVEALNTGLTLAVCGNEKPNWGIALDLSDLGADPTKGLDLAVMKNSLPHVQHFLSKGASTVGLDTDKASKYIQKLIRRHSSTLWDHLLED